MAIQDLPQQFSNALSGNAPTQQAPARNLTGFSGEQLRRSPVGAVGDLLQGFSADIRGGGQSFRARRDTRRQEALRGLDRQRKTALAEDALSIRNLLESGNIDDALTILNDRASRIDQLGGDPTDTLELTARLQSGDVVGVHNEVSTIVEAAQDQRFLERPEGAQLLTSKQVIDGQTVRVDPRTLEATATPVSGFKSKSDSGLTSEQKTFASLTKGLTKEQKEEATLIELGLAPRAVGSAIQTITAQGIADLIGDAEAIISERKKFGELTGSSRSKSIDKGFERITKIDTGLRNIDRAIEVIRSGAGTGAIQRLLPSIRAASVELDNIQGRLALDVIGGVTFGALSKGELDLAKQVALPTGLDGPELVQHLEERKAAQIKVRDYFQEQIDFLDQGGTVAGFLRSKEREQGGAGQVDVDASQLSDDELRSQLGL